jgi:hypothetical protein
VIILEVGSLAQKGNEHMILAQSAEVPVQSGYTTVYSLQCFRRASFFYGLANGDTFILWNSCQTGEKIKVWL